MKWWMKVALDQMLGNLPGGPHVYRRLQERFGELAHFESSSRWNNAEFYLEALSRHGFRPDEIDVLELGTGWAPVVPLTLALCGASVCTHDVKPLVRDNYYHRTRAGLASRLDRYAEVGGVSLDVMRRRLAEIEPVSRFTEAMALLDGEYVAPCDTLNLPYGEGRFDVVLSNLVLQCVPPHALPPLVDESFRLLRPGGVALHRMWLADENARLDPNRNQLEFLKYPQSTWDRWFNSPQKHINQLRRSQYLRIFADAGFRLRQLSCEIDVPGMRHLESLSLPPERRRMPLTDLATVSLAVVLERPMLATSSAEIRSSFETRDDKPRHEISVSASGR